jgi:ABC-2 type transport system permease protein
MQRYASLYGLFLQQHVKRLAEYRMGFLFSMAALLFEHVASLTTIWIILRQVPALNGWRFREVLLIYGLAIFSQAGAQMFTEQIWIVGIYIRDGAFDRLLVRPINPLFNLLANGFDLAGLCNFLVGGALILITGQTLGIFSVPFNLVYLGVSLISGAVIFFALNLITASSAFWIIDSIPVTGAVFENHLFAQYPLSIYPRLIQFLLTWIIPYGFVSFYPASFLLGHAMGPIVFAGPLVAGVLLVIGYRLWLVGLGRYEGTGS